MKILLIVFAFFLNLPVFAQDCGKYDPVGGKCQRYVTFPWYATGAGWTSQIPVLLPFGSAGAVTVSLGFGTGVNSGLLPGTPFTDVFGGFSGNYEYFSTKQATVVPGGSARLDLLSGAVCASGSCTESDKLAVGTMWATIAGPDAPTLEATTLQLIYLSAPIPGTQTTTQVAVPPVFNDAATGKWMTTFSETPAESKAGDPNALNMAFSVANLSDQAQAVTISLFDLYGVPILSKSTAMLPAGVKSGAQVKPGGVYADTFANFFNLGAAQITNSQALAVLGRTGTIDGTIVFQSSTGQPIAPLVIRTGGNSNSMMLVTPLN